MQKMRIHTHTYLRYEPRKVTVTFLWHLILKVYLIYKQFLKGFWYSRV